jgi:anti-sigma regulatory factor (Ser/Thr protein kinase)
MANMPHKIVALPNRSYQAIARSEIKKLAAGVGFSNKRLAEVELVVAEMTSNLVKHTKDGGQILVKQLPDEQKGIELICIDNGPGMASAARMMEDGMSSTRTMGHGLGAIRRLSDDFDIYSQVNWGTIVLSRIYLKRNNLPSKNKLQVRAIMLAKDGEQVCGDDYTYVTKGNRLKLCISDGLGHGHDAHLSAAASMESFLTHQKATPFQQLRLIHTDIKRTRGSVMSIIDIDAGNKQLTYCGVGNISAKLIGGERSKSLVSYNGIIGHSIPGTIANHVFQWSKNDLLIIHSDGLSSRWDIQKYPMILKHDYSILVAAILKDNIRGNDDVTVIAVTQTKTGQ